MNTFLRRLGAEIINVTLCKIVSFGETFRLQFLFKMCNFYIQTRHTQLTCFKKVGESLHVIDRSALSFSIHFRDSKIGLMIPVT